MVVRRCTHGCTDQAACRRFRAAAAGPVSATRSDIRFLAAKPLGGLHPARTIKAGRTIETGILAHRHDGYLRSFAFVCGCIHAAARNDRVAARPGRPA